ncbi:hypothetical protein N7533_006309 [Penicillium manginii]|uniref:uncharacterized protein n=1 Tax=Penicillium manginii TaxID=203109 RepID=UPI002546EAD2|nr:uncharacterized protein N7533_006309 [Penicillium manginii]KAJ5756766.1 hypothetical protein N7533_006309 [Penicillium manginii]
MVQQTRSAAGSFPRVFNLFGTTAGRCANSPLGGDPGTPPVCQCECQYCTSDVHSASDSAGAYPGLTARTDPHECFPQSASSAFRVFTSAILTTAEAFRGYPHFLVHWISI